MVTRSWEAGEGGRRVASLRRIYAAMAAIAGLGVRNWMLSATISSAKREVPSSACQVRLFNRPLT